MAWKRLTSSGLTKMHERMWLRTCWVVASLVTAAASCADPVLAEEADPPEHWVQGPKQICFKYSVFSLAADERIALSSGSPEAMAVKVESPSGNYRIGESEIFAPPRQAKRLVRSDGPTKVYRVAAPHMRYAIYGPTSFSDGQDRLVIWLSGENLRGAKSDHLIFDRFEVRDPATVKCQYGFTYSWNDFLGPDR